MKMALITRTITFLSLREWALKQMPRLAWPHQSVSIVLIIKSQNLIFFCDQAILILTTSIKGHFRDFLTISDNREVRRDQMTQVQILDVGQYLPFVPIEYPDKCCVLDNDTCSDFEALPFHVQTEEMRRCVFRLWGLALCGKTAVMGDLSKDSPNFTAAWKATWKCQPLYCCIGATGKHKAKI